MDCDGRAGALKTDWTEPLHDAHPIEQRVLGPDHPKTLFARDSLATILTRTGRYVEAEKLERGTLDIEQRVLGPDHPNTQTTITNLAYVLGPEGHYSDSQKLFRQVIESATKRGDVSSIAPAWYDFACMAALAGRRDEALEYLGHAVDNGFGKPEWIVGDDDRKSLHGDPRFEALVAKARQSGTTQPH